MGPGVEEGTFPIEDGDIPSITMLVYQRLQQIPPRILLARQIGWTDSKLLQEIQENSVTFDEGDGGVQDRWNPQHCSKKKREPGDEIGR